VLGGAPLRETLDGVLFSVRFSYLTVPYRRTCQEVKKLMTEPSGNRSPAKSSAEAAFFAALRDLYVRAGEPSTRAMAKEIGGVSHTTLHAAIRGTTVPSWPVVAKLVASLGGDTDTFRELWADTRPNASVRRSNPGPEVSVFVSYARIDDKATYSRVSQLIDGLADTYQSMTGQTVGVFKDVESIKPGDDWRDRIRLGLSASSIFLAFISPAYLRSATCREELSEFLAFLDANSSARLIIPLIFSTPDRILNEFTSDDLWARVAKLQWLDISELRHTDPGSSAWIIAVDRIADRIDEILRTFTQNNDTPSEKAGPGSELSQGTLDRMAAIEARLPDMTASFERYAQLMGRMGNVVEEASPSMKRADSFSKKLAVSDRLARTLNPIADEMDDVADRLVEHLNELTYVAKFVADAVRRNPDEVAPDTVEFLKTIKDTASIGIESFSVIEEFTRSVGQVIGFSKHLDRPLKKIQGASLKVADLRGILSGWQEEVAALQDRYPHLNLAS
jgi:TIR domain